VSKAADTAEPSNDSVVPWRAYLVRCGDGSLYAGVTNDVPRRVAAHAAGRGARYTRARPPVVLAWKSPALEKRAAHRLEARLKRLDRRQKLLITEPVSAARRRLLRELLKELR
jgi:putative endonuclease